MSEEEYKILWKKYQMLNERIKESDIELDLFQSELNKERQTSEELNKKNVELQQKYETLNSDFKLLFNDNTNLEDEIKALKNDLKYSRKLFKDLEKKYKDSENQFKDLENEKFSLLKQLDDLKKNNSKSNELSLIIEKLKTQNCQLQDNLLSVKTTSTSTIDELQSQINSLQLTLEEKDSHISSLENKILFAFQDLEDTKASLSLEDEIIKKMNLKLQNEIRDLQHENTLLFEENSQLKNKKTCCFL